MKILKVRGYTITAWAEQVATGWQGLASVTPGIPNTWSGGPGRDSLICDNVHENQKDAEKAAFDEAETALFEFLDV